ncbi:hypothetical protein [Jejuia pallidilutea]|uniref:Uncharacterized protein n=1 Tax=Jejuia pallidilutea TaxID=504487 RepID=A0A090WYV1_9FLAO|nr:hypothetical protein [Jejuia pallidilutea]GAL72522.1 hypothetical protein JCM19302_2244 [Jejuia pallidilutea]
MNLLLTYLEIILLSITNYKNCFRFLIKKWNYASGVVALKSIAEDLAAII